MNLAGVIGSLASGSYTVTRTAAGDYGQNAPPPDGYAEDVGDGRFRSGATSTLTIKASIQPASGRDLLRLPEGLRAKQSIAIYTATELLTGAAPESVQPDTLVYQGDTYQVQTVEQWNESGAFWKAIALKVQP